MELVLCHLEETGRCAIDIRRDQPSTEYLARTITTLRTSETAEPFSSLRRASYSRPLQTATTDWVSSRGPPHDHQIVDDCAVCGSQHDPGDNERRKQRQPP